jgi:hypothetical protein
MAQRTEPPDSLDWFPTPPWATRALVECVIGREACAKQTAWEPAAGEGHMREVLCEYLRNVHASDVHDYGRGYEIGTFVGVGADRAECPFDPDWVITNPPFASAVEFAERALEEASVGVALLLRSVWIEGAARYERLFRPRPPSIVAFFVERVPMVKGRWDPEASTATSYAWFCWDINERPQPTRLMWIPPGQRQGLEHPDDRRRFAPPPEPMSLFAEGATP